MNKFNCFKPEVDQMLKAIDEGTIPSREAFKRINENIKRLQGIPFSKSFEAKMIIQGLCYTESGRNCIFLDNDTAHHLYNLKFNAEMLDNLPLPLDIFSIATQTNLTILNVPVLPMLVVKNEKRYIGVKKLSELSGLPMQADTDIEINSPNFNFLNVSIREDLSNAAKTMSIGVSLEQLREIINADDESSLLTLKTFELANHLTTEDKRRLFVSLKLVTSLCLYNHITGSEFLLNGTPPNLKPKSLGLQKHELKNFTGFNFSLNVTPTKMSQHLRSGFFRQLVNERYYQNENSNLPRGSRWVEVKPALIGGQAKTQTKED